MPVLHGKDEFSPFDVFTLDPCSRATVGPGGLHLIAADAVENAFGSDAAALVLAADEKKLHLTAFLVR